MGANDVDPHVSCLDAFSVGQVKPHSPRRPPRHALGGLCHIPADPNEAKIHVPTVQLLPGVEVLDLYADSLKSEIWKDGETLTCLVPRRVIGWEFYSLLRPAPDGTTQLRLNPTIELLLGRPPGAQHCPSLLFGYVPAGHIFPGAPPSHITTKHLEHHAPLAQIREKMVGNLNVECRTYASRIVVLVPMLMFKDNHKLPDTTSWGLFIGPRSRTLMLVNRHRGRIDLHLNTLCALDSSFRLGDNLIEATSRLFEPFGSKDKVRELFQNMDPMKIHSGLISALVPDHVQVTTDGREDYRRIFSIRLPHFFLSNASHNLCFLTPSEAQKQRSGSNAPRLETPAPLPDMPLWSLAGFFGDKEHALLEEYRRHVVPPKPQYGHHPQGFLQYAGSLLGLGGFGVGSLGGCTEIAFGGGLATVSPDGQRRDTIPLGGWGNMPPGDYNTRERIPAPSERVSDDDEQEPMSP